MMELLAQAMRKFLQFILFLAFAGPAVLAAAEPDAIDKLTPVEVRTAWEKLNTLIAKTGGIDPVEIERARLQGVLERLGKNARLTEKKSSETTAPGLSFKSEMLPRQILYARLGDLSPDNLTQLTNALRSGARANALILDLRATRGAGSYESAANLVGLFAGGGKTFFSLASGAALSKKAYTWEGDALFTGVVLVLVNEDTNGPGETAAASLRQQIHALIIGKNTAGRALDYVALPINETLELEVATGRIVLPGAAASYLQNGVEPDLTVASPLTQDREFLRCIDKTSAADFIFEIERPHMNEASLVAGKNPEIDEYQTRKADEKKAAEPVLLDRALQRALDAATSLLVLGDSARQGG